MSSGKRKENVHECVPEIEKEDESSARKSGKEASRMSTSSRKSLKESENERKETEHESARKSGNEEKKEESEHESVKNKEKESGNESPRKSENEDKKEESEHGSSRQKEKEIESEQKKSQHESPRKSENEEKKEKESEIEENKEESQHGSDRQKENEEKKEKDLGHEEEKEKSENEEKKEESQHGSPRKDDDNPDQPNEEHDSSDHSDNGIQVIDDPRPSNKDETPLLDDNNEPDIDLFAATAPPKPSLKVRGRRTDCITALDLQSVFNQEDDQPADPATENAIERFKRTGRIPITANPPDLIHQLQRERVNAIIKGDYDHAKECDRVARNVAAAMTRDAEERKKQDLLQQMQEKLEQARAEYEEAREAGQRKIDEEDEQLKQRLYDLSNQHEQEIQRFEKKWNSEDFLRRYTKPSGQLLQMKAIERSMVIARMFDQAKNVRKRASFTEKRESREQQDRAKKEMDIERKRLVERQTREFDLLRLKCTQCMDVTKKQVEEEERPHIKKIRKLERTIEEIRNGKETPVRPATCVVTERGSSAELVSARTTFKFSAFKAAGRSTKLRIKPLGPVSSGPRKSRVMRVKTIGSMK